MIIGLIACVSALGVAGSMVSVTIVNAVNRELPPESRFGMWGWHAAKAFRLRDEYRRLYPDGVLLRRRDMLAVAAFACMGLVAALLFRLV
jgi:hypothetical protein